MKTYEETTRSVFERAETQIQKNKKRNRVIRTAAAFTCLAIFAVTAVFGVKAMMKPDTVTPENTKIKKLAATLIKCDNGDFVKHDDYHAYYDESGNLYKKVYESYYEENALKTATVMVYGKEYTGKYDTTIKTSNTPFNPTDIRLYEVERHENGEFIYFALNKETGALYLFVDAKNHNEKQIDIEDAKAKAKDIADYYLGESADEYNVETDYTTQGFFYEAYRMINGYKSADRMKIVLNNEGDLEQLLLQNTGSFDGIYSLPYSIEQANAVMEETVRELAKDITGFTHYEYNDVTPIVLQSGKVGLLYTVHVHATIGDWKGGWLYYYIVSFEE